MHPDCERFPYCPFDDNAGRIRPCGDRFCRAPERLGQLVRLSVCLGCPHAGLATAPPRPPRCGDVLAELLKRDHGAVVSSECNCQNRIDQMNAWGPDGCEREMETIVGWLIDAAKSVAGRHNLAPDWAKRWKLRPLVKEAIRTVREWTPPGAEAEALAA